MNKVANNQPARDPDWGCMVIVLAVIGCIALATICETLVRIFG